MDHNFKDAGVVGLGLMGFEIAFLYAMKGYRTLVYDASETVMEGLAGRTEQTIERLKRRNRITEGEIASVRQRLVKTAGLQELAEVSLVTEAVSEAKALKLTVYQALRDSGFAGIVTTNTSSLTQTSLRAGGAFDPRKFVTTHFFNPVLYTEMVEVVRGQLDGDSFHQIISFLQGLGRRPVETKDISGFVSNSVLMYYTIMALHLLQSGGKIDAVDQAAKQLGLLPPFISFDSWKPSIVEDVTRVMFELRRDEFLRSSKILPLLAEKNPPFYLDRKPNPAIYELIGATGEIADGTIQMALTTTMRLAAVRAVELGESPATVDFISVEGLKIPRPPLQEIDRMGATALVEDLRKVNEAMPGVNLPVRRLLGAMAGERQSFYHNGQVNPWLISFQDSHAGH